MFLFMNNTQPLRAYDGQLRNSVRGHLTLIAYNTTINPGAQFQRDDGALQIGTIVATYVVSSNILTTVSEEFEQTYASSNWLETSEICAYVALDIESAFPLEAFLRAIHDEVSDAMYFLSPQEVNRVVDIAQIFGCHVSKLNYWFSQWLANQHISNKPIEFRREVEDLCKRFNHPWGLECLDKIQNPDPHFQQAIANYPPVLVKSYRQLSATIFLARDIKPSDYQSAGYSPAFCHRYGIPTDYWTDFYRLMTTATEDELSRKNTTLQNFSKIHFLEFAKEIDHKLKQQGRSDVVVWRDTMEAMFTKTAIRLFDKESEGWGDVFRDSVRIRTVMQIDLRHAIRQRFHPIGKVERYWKQKAETFGGTAADILKKNLGHDEPDGEMQLAAPELGEVDLDMDVLGELMATLHVQTEKQTAEEDGVTAEEAMIEARRRLLSTS